MSTDAKLLEVYDGYYADGKVSEKRTRTAVQTFNHISTITDGKHFCRVLDIGAGDGAVLAELAKRGFADEYAAVEISGSGIEAINNRKIEAIKSVESFDGYKIPHKDHAFDLGLAIHVLEHVEHERMFLREAARVCKQIYVEIPLEHTSHLSKAIQSSARFGHINFYTSEIFANLLQTSGLRIDKLIVFPYDLEFEQFISGKFRGWLKYQIRSKCFKLMPGFAMRHIHYMAGALCSAID
jgi:SAM-dependent methyltransferase